MVAIFLHITSSNIVMYFFLFVGLFPFLCVSPLFVSIMYNVNETIMNLIMMVLDICFLKS